MYIYICKHISLNNKNSLSICKHMYTYTKIQSFLASIFFSRTGQLGNVISEHPTMNQGVCTEVLQNFSSLMKN